MKGPTSSVVTKNYNKYPKGKSSSMFTGTKVNRKNK